MRTRNKRLADFDLIITAILLESRKYEQVLAKLSQATKASEACGVPLPGQIKLWPSALFNLFVDK